MRPRFLPLFAAAALAAITACSDDPNDPAANIPGSYHATSFTVSSNGQTVDLIAVGATLNMTLASDHSTTGRLTVPVFFTGGAAVDESLAGTWRETNDTVYFEEPADTFVRDAAFAVHGSTLVADAITTSSEIKVTLSK